MLSSQSSDELARTRQREEDTPLGEPPAKRSRVDSSMESPRETQDITSVKPPSGILASDLGLVADPQSMGTAQPDGPAALGSLDEQHQLASPVGPVLVAHNAGPAPSYDMDNLLPASLALLSVPLRTDLDQAYPSTREVEVGISEYVSKDVPTIQGIIKQRFTDFLVYEVDMKGQVIRLKDIGSPKDAGSFSNDVPGEPKIEIAPADDNMDGETVPHPVMVTEGSVPELEIPDVDEIQALETGNDGVDEEELGGAIDLGSHEDEEEQPPIEKSSAAAQPEVAGDPPSSLVQQPATVKPLFEMQPQKDASSTDFAWSDQCVTRLSAFMSPEALSELEEMYKQGLVPPLVSDSGWAGRKSRVDEPPAAEADTEVNLTPQVESNAVESGSARGKKNKRGRDRGGRGGRGDRGRGRGRGGFSGRPNAREDLRRVTSDPIPSKDDRANFHKAVRELFGGRLETETVEGKGEAQCISIKWNHSSRGGSSTRGPPRRDGHREQDPVLKEFPYIHFTLQKTNRETQDALSHLSRLLKCTHKDLAVAGTKDKRAVTVQRVCLKRNRKTLEEVWKAVNGVGRRRSAQRALQSRGERGVRVADLEYSKGHLALGMLKGNEFAIALRNVKVDSLETVDRAMTSLRENGFINYYGMQRFGTSAVPTHAIGLAILQSDYKKAVSLILRPRPGEDPECEAGRRAWLDNHDLVQALLLLPRRVVAERCILDAFKKSGDPQNYNGALSTIPRNMLMMYVHAYQSYVWNAVVSARINKYGCDAPVVGDLVFDTSEIQAAPAETTEQKSDSILTDPQDGTKVEDPAAVRVDIEIPDPEEFSSGKRFGRNGAFPRVKVLAEADLPNYTILDVVMPLPGFDVSYPGGELGLLYQSLLKADGLDPDALMRKQKEYSLPGSYRKIMHLPKHVSWSTVRYTNPDEALLQSDEDKILKFDPPKVDPNGKFLALVIKLTLGTAAYATMALREVTKTETSSQYQSALTLASEDQQFRVPTEPETGATDAI